MDQVSNDWPPQGASIETYLAWCRDRGLYVALVLEESGPLLVYVHGDVGASGTVTGADDVPSEQVAENYAVMLRHQICSAIYQPNKKLENLKSELTETLRTAPRSETNDDTRIIRWDQPSPPNA